MTRTGYCPICQQNVLLVREDINVGLAIILLIFTAGIGLIIYLIVYYGNEEDRCIHCKALVATGNIPYTQKSSSISYQEKRQYNQKVEQIQAHRPNFCPFCGAQLEKDDAKFCFNCGSKI